MKKQNHIYQWLDYWKEIYYQPSVSPSTYEISEYYVSIIKNHFIEH